MGDVLRRLTYIRAPSVQFLYRSLGKPGHAWIVGGNYSAREQAGSDRPIESSREDSASRSASTIAIGSGSRGSAGGEREDQVSRLPDFPGVNDRHFEPVWKRLR